MQIDSVLQKLERFGISTTNHTQENLRSHLKGTCQILQRWGCSQAVCLSGLCHSIYGTESFLKSPATLDNREYVRNLIGGEGERLAYLFGAHKKESLWKNLGLANDFQVHDRFTEQEVAISRDELSSLITITLANWLEQRPRSSPEYQFIRLTEFQSSKPFLPALGYQEFLEAYNLMT